MSDDELNMTDDEFSILKVSATLFGKLTSNIFSLK